jgi:Fe-S-cluster-containing hydrogenase component 2
MDAVKLNADEIATVDRDRCIGGGLCVTTCPSEAITLKAKPESERQTPPATGKDYFLQLAAQRGATLIPLSVTRKQGQ